MTNPRVVPEPTPSGGVTDHGALTGLADDDHPQYVHEGSAIAKGDMIAAPAANDYQRFAVGVDGTILEADSAATVGVKWGTKPITAHIIQDEASDLTHRTKISFQGTGVTAADSGARTIVTIPGETLPATLADAKGDLIVATGADAFARLAVGANGSVPVADSTQTSGILWVPRRYAVVQDESSDLTPRGKLSFQGAGVTATDDSGNDRTIVTIPAAPAAETSTPVKVTHRGETAGADSDYARGDHRHQRGKVPLLRKSSTANQSLTSGAATNLIFQTTDHNLVETGDTAFTVVSTSLFSPPVDGLYAVTAQIEFVAATDASRRIVTLFNNSDTLTLLQISTPAIAGPGQSTLVLLAAVWDLLAAKQYAIRGRQDSGGALNVGSGSTFQCMWVGPSS